MNIAQSLMAGVGRCDLLMRPGDIAIWRYLRDDAREGALGSFRFPVMNHRATLRGPSGARHLQNTLSGYSLKTHKAGATQIFHNVISELILRNFRIKCF
jgi:hypothetical protein